MRHTPSGEHPYLAVRLRDSLTRRYGRRSLMSCQRTICHKEESNLNFVPAIRTTHTGYGLTLFRKIPGTWMFFQFSDFLFFICFFHFFVFLVLPRYLQPLVIWHRETLTPPQSHRPQSPALPHRNDAVLMEC